MDRATELDLALDVHDLAAARPHPAGDARRPPETEAAQLEHAQAVHLAGAAADGVDQRHVLQNRFLRTIAQPRHAADLLVEGALDFGAADHRALGLAGPVVGFRQHVTDLIDQQRELAGVVGDPRGMLQQQRDAVARDRLEAVMRHDRRNQPSVQRLARGRAVDLVLEVGEHLEVLADLGIERHQQVVEQPTAEQNDLDVERDRVRLERHRAGQADETTDVLDPDLALAERALQRRPAERLHQQVAHVEQQEAAIGAMGGARLDLAEIRDQHALM